MKQINWDGLNLAGLQAIAGMGGPNADEARARLAQGLFQAPAQPTQPQQPGQPVQERTFDQAMQTAQLALQQAQMLASGPVQMEMAVTLLDAFTEATASGPVPETPVEEPSS